MFSNSFKLSDIFTKITVLHQIENEHTKLIHFNSSINKRLLILHITTPMWY